ncbi:MAG: hypothetical protein ACFFAO_18495 [Candidatus Hermodarchaeota archaeon]
MIYGDISEKKDTHKAFKKRLGDRYQIKELGSWDCSLEKIPLINNNKIYCVLPHEFDLLCDKGFNYDQNKVKCIECLYKDYVRFADFEIGEKRAYYERKTAADFVASRKRRLYEQLIKMDTFIQDGRKGLILEGIARSKSDGFFSGYDSKIHDLDSMSPLEIGYYILTQFVRDDTITISSVNIYIIRPDQAIELGGGESTKNWTISFIREIFRGFLYSI